MTRVVLLKQASEITGLSTWELSTGSKSGKYPFMRIGGPRGRIAFNLDLLESRIQELMQENIRQVQIQEPEYGQLRRIKA